MVLRQAVATVMDDTKLTKQCGNIKLRKAQALPVGDFSELTTLSFHRLTAYAGRRSVAYLHLKL